MRVTLKLCKDSSGLKTGKAQVECVRPAVKMDKTVKQSSKMSAHETVQQMDLSAGLSRPAAKTGRPLTEDEAAESAAPPTIQSPKPKPKGR